MHGLIILKDLVILLALSIPVVALAQRLRIPAIVGFLSVGVLVGPHGFGWIGQPEIVRELAEVGVILLLFTIGLELSLSRIMKLGRLVLQGGMLQVGLTLCAFAAVSHIVFQAPVNRALFYGSLVALSSTAIVLRVYADRDELDTPQGRVAVSILLFQDLAVVPLMLLVPILAAGSSGGAMPWGRLAWGVLTVIVLLGLGRFVIPWILQQVALLRNRELFTLCVGFFGLFAAFLTAEAGLSLALGAFLAGLVISESEYGLQALSDILPFRDAFSGIFFTSVGMLLDIDFVLQSLVLVLGVTLFVIVLKAVIVTLVTLTLRRSLAVSLVSGLGLAQVGEFSFVLASVGRPLGLFAVNDYQMFLAASVLSMLLAPLLIAISPKLAQGVVGRLGRSTLGLFSTLEDEEELRDHAIIVGYGISGKHLTRVLHAAQIPYVVLDQNGQQVQRARAEGIRIRFGDGTRREVLEHVGIGQARVVVFAIASPNDEKRGVAMTRHLNPSVRIVVRTRYVLSIDELMRLGATEVVVEEFEASLELFARVLEFYEIPTNVIHHELELVRSEHYGLLRAAARPNIKLDALQHLGIHAALELIEVEDGSRAVGENPTSLDLRRKTGSVVLAVVRDGVAIYKRDPSFLFRTGDTVVLVGDADSLQKGSELFQSMT
jgi:CPA2 family monovalent cation:H+ antiporter-2